MNKKIKLFDAVLMSVCITLALGSVAPAASIGLSSIFWWILLLIIFFYPYGLVTAELGTAYPEDGGIYDWIKLAYGRVWGARVTWYYWINYAFGMGSNGILFALFIQKMTGCKFSPLLISVIALIFVWLSAWLGMLKISQNIWILNIGAACKAFVILTLVFAGVYSAFTAAKLANSFSFDSLKPDFSVGMRFLPMIIFNLLGFEVITSVAGNMQNPGRQIPKAIIIGGILIAFFYVVSTVGVLIAVPVAKLSTSTGILESLSTILGHGNIANYFIFFCGILVLFTLIANLVSWAVGINYVATYAAENNDFPKIFAKKTAEHKLPVGVFFINGIVSTILISLYYFFLVFGFSGDLFWNIFSINAIIFLMSYVMLFPAFYTLRKKNPDKNHPFKVKGGKVKIWLIGYVPAFLLMAVLVLFFYVPGVPFNYPYFYRVGGMLLLTAIVGEIVIWKVHRNKN